MAKILFCQEIYFPFQSTSKLSAFLKRAGHQVDVIVGEGQKVVDHIKKSNPDLIGFSVLTPYRNHMLNVAATIKQAGIKTPIIAGGYDITFLPAIIEYSDLDIICRGEGEEPLVDLLNRIDAKQDYTDVKNLWVKQDGKIYKNSMRTWTMDMDAMPFDDRDLYLDYDSVFKIFPFMQVLAGRGCPYPCSYCFNRGYHEIYRAEGSTKYCNLRSPDHVIEELLILKNKYKAPYIFFNDSTLAYNRAWLAEFLIKYKEKIQLPFSLNAVITEITEEVGAMLKECGYCELVRWGFEAGNEEYRMKILNKKITDEQAFKGAKILQKNGIRYSTAMMLGLPGETIDMTIQTLDMARKLTYGNSSHGICVFKPFPGLEVAEYGVAIGQYNRDEVSAFDLPEVLRRNKIIIAAEEGSALQATPAEDTSKEDIQKTAMGTRKMVFFNNYRIDPEGSKILRLSRFSHIIIRMPSLLPLIMFLIKFPDNFIYRFVWTATEALLNIRVHARVPFSFFVKYYLFHYGKQLR